jgi:hypothetical protein
MVNDYQRPVWVEGYSIYYYPNHKMKSCKAGSFKNSVNGGF